MARMIDGDAVTKRLRAWLESPHGENVYNSGYDDAIWHVLDVIEHMPTLTQPNEWVSVYDRLPEPGERVLATDCGFVGEFYINKRGKWQRYNVNCSELLMALDILYWVPLPAPPDRRPPEGEEGKR